MKISCILNARAELGEGPVWCPESDYLYWVDILAPAIHRFDASSGSDESKTMPSLVGCVALSNRENLIVALQQGIGSFHWNKNQLEILTHPENRIDNRYNDGKCDARNRFWVGSMNLGEREPTGSLYRIDGNWKAERMLGHLIISNGIGWSPDHRRMYLADSGADVIYEFDFDIDEGTICNQQIFAKSPVAGAVPDGLTVDTEGCIWCAFWGGSCILRFTPQGRVDRRIDLPVPRPTNLTFGGSALQMLFVTSARKGLDPVWCNRHAPLSGGLFLIENTGAQGFAANRFNNEDQR